MRKRLLGLFCVLSCIQLYAADFVTLRSEAPGQIQLTEEALMATHLRIEGSIDARDFETLKKVTINRTRVLDLSDATIEYYKGYGCYVDLSPSYIVGNKPVIEYRANVLPNYAFCEMRDNSLYKWCAGSTTLSRIILPKTLEDIAPNAFVDCTKLIELCTVEGSNLTSKDNAVVYTKDEKRLVRVAPAYSGKLELSSLTDEVDSCALVDVSLSGLIITSEEIPSFKGASLVKSAYIESKLVDECKAIFPELDCIETIQTIEVTNNETEGILTALGELGCKRDEVRSVIVSGVLSQEDVNALFALPNLYYADLSNATTTSTYVKLNQTKMCEVKMPQGSYRLDICENSFLSGNLVIPEGVHGLYYIENNHKEIVFPSTLTSLYEVSFKNSNIRKADFSACVELTQMNSVFLGCANLTTLILPPALESLSGVSDAPIQYITFPETLQELDYFNGSDLEEIVLPASLKKLSGFSEMSKLRKINASKATALSQISHDVFNSCPFVETLDLSDSPITEFYGFNGGQDTAPKTRIVAMGGTKHPAPFIPNRISSVKLPSTLKLIEGFNDSPLLTEVNLDHCYQLERISGFDNCACLEKISIPYSLKQFDLTLNGCANIQSIRSAALQPPTINASLSTDKMSQITVYVPVGKKGVYYMTEGWDKCKEVVEIGYSVMAEQNSNSYMIDGTGLYNTGESVTLSAAPYSANELQSAIVKGWYINDTWHEGETVTFVPDANCVVNPVYALSAPDFSLAQISFVFQAPKDTIHTIRIGVEGTIKIFDENGVVIQDKTNSYKEYTLQLKQGTQKYAIVGNIFDIELNPKVFQQQTNTPVMSQLMIKDKGIRFFTAQYLGLEMLDLSGCPQLNRVSAYGNNLQTLVLGDKPQLTSLSLGRNALQELDLSGSPSLESLSAYENNLQTLVLGDKPQLTTLDLAGNALQELDLNGCPSLESLYTNGNNLQTLVLGDKPQLTNLLLEGNALQELDLNGCPSLVYLSANENNLQTLVLDDKPQLTSLSLGRNALQELDLSGCPSLESLSAYENNLQTLVLGDKPQLTNLYVPENALKELDLSGCPSLESLYVDMNELKHLDVPSAQLRWFSWRHNPMAFSCLTPQLYEDLKKSDQFSDEYRTCYTFSVLKDMIDENGVLDLTYELSKNTQSSATEIVLSGPNEEIESGKFSLSEREYPYRMTFTNPNYPQLFFESYFKIADLTGIDELMENNLKIRVAGSSVFVSDLKDNTEVALVTSAGMVLDKAKYSCDGITLNTNNYKGVCILQISNEVSNVDVKLIIN